MLDRKKNSGSLYRKCHNHHTIPSYFGCKMINLPSVQGVVGHANLSTTLNIYTHSSKKGKRRAVDKFSELLSETLRGRCPEGTSRSLERIEILRSWRKPLNLLVPGARIELALCYQNRILNPARLPVPPPRRAFYVEP